MPQPSSHYTEANGLRLHYTEAGQGGSNPPPPRLPNQQPPLPQHPPRARQNPPRHRARPPRLRPLRQTPRRNVRLPLLRRHPERLPRRARHRTNKPSRPRPRRPRRPLLGGRKPNTRLEHRHPQHTHLPRSPLDSDRLPPRPPHPRPPHLPHEAPKASSPP